LSKNETTQVSSKDMFSKYQENIDKMFNSVKRSVPRYHQSSTNIQQELLQSFENMVDLSIMIQKEFVKKVGIASNTPTSILNVIDDTSEEFVKATSIQNQIMLTTIDATQQNIKTFNDNVKSLADLNKNILQSWISTFTTKCN
jgi:Ni,Fe-hydrogenase I large subunit